MSGKEDRFHLNLVQRPFSDVNSSSASQIPHILCNTKVYYKVHKSLSRVPTLRQITQIHFSSPSI